MIAVVLTAFAAFAQRPLTPQSANNSNDVVSPDGGFDIVAGFCDDVAAPMLAPLTSRWKEVTPPVSVGDFSLPRPGGGRITLSSFKGKVVVLAVMFSDCGHLQTALLLQEWYSEMASKGFQPIAVEIDRSNFASDGKDVKVEFPVSHIRLGESGSNGEFTNLQRFLQMQPTDRWSLPTLALIDRGGTVRIIHSMNAYVQTESLNAQTGNALLEIRALLGGDADPVTILEVKPGAEGGSVYGDVGIKLTVGIDGKPQNVEVTKSLDATADDRATESVKQWRFIPRMRDGKFVPQIANVVITYGSPK